MDRLVAALLAAALGAPPDTTTAPVPVEPVADELSGDEAPPADATGEPDPMGLPSVEDPPEQTPEPAPEPVAAPAAPEGPAPAPSPAPPPVGKDRLGCEFSKSCRQLTITGTVLGGLGLAAVGIGVALYVREDEVLADEPAYARSTKPPGLIALTLGAGVVVTSVLMLVASHRGAKERDRADASAWRSMLRGRF